MLVAVGPCRDTAAATAAVDVDVAAAATSSSPSNAVPFLLRPRSRRYNSLVIVFVTVLAVCM